jgi:hypothetical protein
LPEAQLVDQPGLLNAMEGVWTDEVHGLYGQKMVMQQFKDEEIRVVDGFLRYAKKDAVIFVEEGTGLEHRFTPKDLFSQVPRLGSSVVGGCLILYLLTRTMNTR